MIKEEITLETLCIESVTVHVQRIIEIDGTLERIGLPITKAYFNSPRGRIKVENALPSQYKNAIFSIWGSKPVLTNELERIEPIVEESTGSSIETEDGGI